jgi:hypothetical protein
MRFYELNTGYRMPASNEESDLIESAIEKGKLLNDELDYRQQEVARKLVSRGLLERIFIDKKMYFMFNEV